MDQEYELVWRKWALPTENEIVPGGTWLVFADEAQLSCALVAAFEDRGQRCIRLRPAVWFERRAGWEYGVRPGETADVLRVLRAHAEENVRGLIHLWSLDSLPGDFESAMRRSERRGSLTALAALKAVAEALGESAPRLWLITRNAQIVNPSPALKADSALQAGLWGMGRVLALEHPDLWGGLIDVDFEGEVKDRAAVVRRLVTDAGPGEDQWAVRDDGVYVPRLEARFRPVAKARPRRALSSGAVYLVTGKLQGTAGRIATRLLKRGAKEVVVATDVGECDQEERLGSLGKWREQGCLDRVALDFDDFGQVESLIGSVERRAPLGGIIHAVGFETEGMLIQEDPKRLRRVLSIRAHSAWNLHRITKGRSLEFFICISSAASFVPVPGEGAVAVADALVDSLVHLRRAEALPSFSVHWGRWCDQATGANSATRRVDRLARLGWSRVSEGDALGFLDEELESHGGARTILVGVDWDRYTRALFQVPSLVRELTSEADGGAAIRSADAEATRRIVDAPAANRVSLAARYLQEVIGDLLQREDGREIDVRDGLFDLGLDSLSLLQLKNRLQMAFGKAIPITVAFNHPTVEGLARYFVQDVMQLETAGQGRAASAETGDGLAAALAEVEAMSDEEAEALLVSECEGTELTD